MYEMLARLIVDDRGQDLIEYALLTGAIGFAGVAAFDALGGSINATYSSWDDGVNDLWIVPDPQGD
jgi:Flp pilus assembly pilin Flp